MTHGSTYFPILSWSLAGEKGTQAKGLRVGTGQPGCQLGPPRKAAGLTSSTARSSASPRPSSSSVSNWNFLARKRIQKLWHSGGTQHQGPQGRCWCWGGCRATSDQQSPPCPESLEVPSLYTACRGLTNPLLRCFSPTPGPSLSSSHPHELSVP